jgi:pyridoxamine 5'-phosphate oxidase
VCLSFYWPNFERQVIVNGKATKISKTDSVEYFDRRPKGSKIGAIISNQSNVIESRDLLDKKFSELLKSGIPLNKPNYWGGYLVKPTEIEFWQGRENRLHDRIIYKNDDKNWKFYRLSP